MKPLSPGVKVAIIVVFVALGLFAMLWNPANPRQVGSTYGQTPAGYGAWYAQLQTQSGVQVERWQRPSAELVERHPETGQVFVQVTQDYIGLSESLSDWIESGNILIQIGGQPQPPVSDAPFRSEISSPQGTVVLETRRRAMPDDASELLLVDDYGAIAWSTPRGLGQIVRIAPPYFAANAYQNAPGNFAFLTALVTGKTNPPTKEVRFDVSQTQPQQVWVDEYLHGHVDAPSPDAAETDPNIWQYLLGTPLAIVMLQGAIALIIALLALNQRFGLPQPLSEPRPNNSQAYIEALAAVLSKAEQQNFVVELLAPEQQRQLQVQLGLGSGLLKESELVAAWVAQTGQPPELLQKLLRQAQRDRRWSQAQLVQWLQQWHQLHQTPLG
ncbi:MAG: DUF4350 domain-containing protein [Spirulina sp. SIO3F2]|nr:DUF4350 domain-containing protein [Spirulina sp. SIO3F2]